MTTSGRLCRLLRGPKQVKPVGFPPRPCCAIEPREEIQMIETTKTDDVFVLTMVAEENRFNPTMLAAFGTALDEVEA